MTPKINDGFKLSKLLQFCKIQCSKNSLKKEFLIALIFHFLCTERNVVMHTLNACEDFIEDILNYVCRDSIPKKIYKHP